MRREVIKFPSIKSDVVGYRRLLGVINAIREDPTCHYDIDFKHCSRIDHNAVAMLGIVARYIEGFNSKNKIIGESFGGVRSGGVMFRVNTMSEIVSKKLIENNFLSHFSKEGFSGYPTGGYIGYREHGELLRADEIAIHLRDEWLTDEKIKLSVELKSAIVSKIFEIFMNAYGHGGAGSGPVIGAVSCGEYDRKESLLKLCVVDFGIGVCESVRRYIDPDFSDVEALNWALKPGNSTQSDSMGSPIPRGLGFDLLKEFVCVNKGKIEVYTNGCYAVADADGGYRVSKSGYDFKGTVINIEINCDDRYYRFYKEVDDSVPSFF